ncbi:MAG: hypothetical protein AB7E55_29380 [Pigmentiphaga sp.]
MRPRERWSYWWSAARTLARRPAATATDGKADLRRRLAMARHHAIVFAAGAVGALVVVPWLGWAWVAVATWATTEAALAAYRHWCLRTGKYAGIRHFLRRPGEWRPR